MPSENIYLMPPFPAIKIFISYCHGDHKDLLKPKAWKVDETLRKIVPHADIWIDKNDLYGKLVSVKKVIPAKDCVISLISKRYEKSKNCMDELNTARDSNIKTIYCNLDGSFNPSKSPVLSDFIIPDENLYHDLSMPAALIPGTKRLAMELNEFWRDKLYEIIFNKLFTQSIEIGENYLARVCPICRVQKREKLDIGNVPQNLLFSLYTLLNSTKNGVVFQSEKATGKTFALMDLIKDFKKHVNGIPERYKVILYLPLNYLKMRQVFLMGRNSISFDCKFFRNICNELPEWFDAVFEKEEFRKSILTIIDDVENIETDTIVKLISEFNTYTIISISSSECADILANILKFEIKSYVFEDIELSILEAMTINRIYMFCDPQLISSENIRTRLSISKSPKLLKCLKPITYYSIFAQLIILDYHNKMLNLDSEYDIIFAFLIVSILNKLTKPLPLSDIKENLVSKGMHFIENRLKTDVVGHHRKCICLSEEQKCIQTALLISDIYDKRLCSEPQIFENMLISKSASRNHISLARHHQLCLETFSSYSYFTLIDDFESALDKIRNIVEIIEEENQLKYVLKLYDDGKRLNLDNRFLKLIHSLMLSFFDRIDVKGKIILKILKSQVKLPEQFLQIALDVFQLNNKDLEYIEIPHLRILMPNPLSKLGANCPLKIGDENCIFYLEEGDSSRNVLLRWQNSNEYVKPEDVEYISTDIIEKSILKGMTYTDFKDDSEYDLNYCDENSLKFFLKKFQNLDIQQLKKLEIQFLLKYDNLNTDLSNILNQLENNLEHLNISNNIFLRNDAIKLLKDRNLQNLKILHAHNVGLNNQCKLMLNNVLQSCAMLEDFDLSFNPDLGNVSLEALKKSEMKSLKSLNLQKTGLKYNSLQCLEDVLINNINIEYLYLSYNPELGDGILSCIKGIKLLDLALLNIHDVGISKTLKVLREIKKIENSKIVIHY